MNAIYSYLELIVAYGLIITFFWLGCQIASDSRGARWLMYLYIAGTSLKMAFALAGVS